MIKRISFLVVLFSAFFVFSQQSADTILIKNHLETIVNGYGYRDYTHTENLDSIAEYIKKHFEKYSEKVMYQPYTIVRHKKDTFHFKNVIASFGKMDAPRIIIGAHYDANEEKPAADDNASGTVGLLELARLLQNAPLNYRVDLVAYSTEEPPFFNTTSMGSYLHAQALKNQNIPVYGMISLEMIGYFDDTPGSQEYPLGALKAIFGNKGDYITLVNKMGKGKFSRKFQKAFIENAQIRTVSFSGPKFMKGLDWSDHYNYWDAGFSALMITDTAFYRNKNYHKDSDTIETLDIPNMALVINSVYKALLDLD